MPKRRTSLWRRLLFMTMILLSTYVVAETIASLGMRYGIFRRLDVRVYVDSPRGVTFCPIRGYRFSQTPSPYARIVRNKLDFIGAYYGNNEGFPDRDDFSPRRTGDGKRRIAVFGDSFSGNIHQAKLARSCRRPLA